MSRVRPNGLRYGVDGYPYLLGLAGIVVGLGVLGRIGRGSGATPLRYAGRLSTVLSVVAAVPFVLGGRYVWRGKLALRDRMLHQVRWTGAETVADLGAGAGLLGIGAAGRTTGTVYCVDLFIGKDLLGNSAGRLRRNARDAGVAERIDIRTEDVRATSLPDHSVDVVLSSLCLHNLDGATERRRVLAEVARVVAPEGTAVISDLAHVDEEYAPYLRQAGWRVSEVGRVPGTFPPQRMLTASAPR